MNLTFNELCYNTKLIMIIMIMKLMEINLTVKRIWVQKDIRRNIVTQALCFP